MIDPTRWILVEAWLSLGLRVEFAAGHMNIKWQESIDGGRRFYYEGYGAWIIELHNEDRKTFGFERATTPELTTRDMAHELAHYIAATEEQREKSNFGMSDDGDGFQNIDLENRALLVEQGIHALVRAAANIAAMALGGRGK